LIVALDVATPNEAKALVERLGDAARFYKLGLELFMAGGYFELLEWLVKRGSKVFVDLKFFDVPETVRRAVASLRGRGVSFTTVHGNQAMMEAAAREKGEVKILAVTALTSLDRGDLDDLGFSCDLERLVLSRARRLTRMVGKFSSSRSPTWSASSSVSSQAKRACGKRPASSKNPGRYCVHRSHHSAQMHVTSNSRPLMVFIRLRPCLICSMPWWESSGSSRSPGC